MSHDPLPLFDLARFRRQTLDDPAFQVEVLALFVAELERLMHQVEHASDALVRAERLRAVATLARDTGAVRLNRAARLAEAHLGLESADLDGLRTAVADTLSYLRYLEG